MFDEELHFNHPLRWGMVGGGRGSQIGHIHRAAAKSDGLFELVAGAFDVDAERGREFGTNIGVAPERCYPDYQTMFEKEATRSDGLEVVSIATPNFTHYEICKAALQNNLHVICEKPLCFTTAQAQELYQLSEEKNKLLGITYGYAGAQMIHQAKNMIEQGEIGEVRIIQMRFAHGHHSSAVEDKDAGTKWRVMPETAGPTYVLGDIGTHALFIAQTMVPKLKIESLLCSRQSFVPERAPLEDNATVLFNFAQGAVGTLWASAVNAGSMHQLKVRVIGSKASVEWWDEHPNQLKYEVQGKPAQVMERGMGYLFSEDDAVAMDRIGAGHAEGLFEAWYNLYRRFAMVVEAKNKHDQDMLQSVWYPDAGHGLEGIRFLERCVESAEKGSVWVDY